MVEDEERRPPLGARVAADTQARFREWVADEVGNSRGEYGRAVERAIEEYMDNDRYTRIEERLTALESTVKHTNAMVRQLVTAEKEKGVFLDGAVGGHVPDGNTAGDRRAREDAVVAAWVDRATPDGDLTRTLTQRSLDGLISEVAGVGSPPTKRDYRESLVERGLAEVDVGNYRLTDRAIEAAGVAPPE